MQAQFPRGVEGARTRHVHLVGCSYSIWVVQIVRAPPCGGARSINERGVAGGRIQEAAGGVGESCRRLEGAFEGEGDVCPLNSSPLRRSFKCTQRRPIAQFVSSKKMTI